MIDATKVLRAQGIYYLVTGLWPLIHYGSFVAVTGPKVDDWLVRMVGLLAAAIGATLYVAAQRGTRSLEIVQLAITSALAFTAIDIWYALKGRISSIYLGDAIVELALVALLMTRRSA